MNILKYFWLGVAFSIPFWLSAQSEKINAEEFLQDIDEQIPQLLSDFNVPGAALCIIHDGKVVLQKGYGLSNVSEGTEVSTTTGFNIGSISKTVSAWGIMKLVEEGKIGLDDPAEKYLSRWKLPESEFDPDGVTIRRLLSHTAGLSLHGYPGWSPNDTLPTIEESLNGKNNGPGRVEIIMEPGTQWKYSGGGYTILQLVIEEVTGSKFEDFMQSEVLAPLGMSNSSFTIDDQIMKHSSAEYDAFGNRIDFELFTAQAAAGFHTTIEDFTRFVFANLNLNGQSLLTGSNIELMMSPAPSSDDRYGLGYQVDAFRGTSEILRGHSGANTGWHAVFEVNPRTNDALIMFTNGGAGYNIYRQIFCEWVSWKYNAELGGGCISRIPIINKLKPIIDTEGIEVATKKYWELKNADGSNLDFSERHLNVLGYTYFEEGDMEKAIAVFKLNIEAFPLSANTYDSYAEALLKNGNEEGAIENYKKSVELNPGNAHAIEVLKELGVNMDDILKEVEIADEVLQSYTGRYELAPDFIIAITLEGKQLFTQAPGQDKLPIYPRSENVFYLQDIEAQLTFNSNKKGKVESFTLLQGGREGVAPRVKD